MSCHLPDCELHKYGMLPLTSECAARPGFDRSTPSTTTTMRPRCLKCVSRVCVDPQPACFAPCQPAPHGKGLVGVTSLEQAPLRHPTAPGVVCDRAVVTLYQHGFEP